MINNENYRTKVVRSVSSKRTWASVRGAAAETAAAAARARIATLVADILTRETRENETKEKEQVETDERREIQHITQQKAIKRFELHRNLTT